MIELRFQGWFQCRLATDPDPYDEPRGVSGYVRAYAGEPDLDRVVRFQRPPFVRRHSPEIGVAIAEVVGDGTAVAGHPLIGTPVELLGEPRFEGRNGVVAEDGYEPIWPFQLSISRPPFRLERAVVANDPEYPYPEFLAAGVEAGPEVLQELRAATGVQDLLALWDERARRLSEDLDGGLGSPDAVAVRERLTFLREARSTARFFGARMSYDYALRSDPVLEDPENLLGAAIIADETWPVRFWLGAWDADVLCGFAKGALSLPVQGTAALSAFPPRSLRRENVGTRRAG